MNKQRLIAYRLHLAVALVLSMSLAGSACFESEVGETFYGRVEVPQAQEFRWSDGGVPRVFDPALAAAPPDTDVVRAMFEGLTDYDPRNLAPVSAVATRWESTAGARVWTFYLREDARWSNCHAGTAQDFVRSWQRTLRLADRAPHAKLLDNIEGAQSILQTVAPGVQTAPPARPGTDGSPQTEAQQNASAARDAGSPRGPGAVSSSPAVGANPFGATALNDQTLRVHLQRPDGNFPALVAHPVFRPVHALSGGADERQAEGESPVATEPGGGASAEVVSNGAFRLASQAADSVVLERASNYWDMRAVSLERVRFVASKGAEESLAAYRAGEVDAVTNAAFEPLALKLLAPYKDFRRATYGALTYYSFNTSNPPFDDVRVREALAIALDRERLSGDTLGGATEPAKRFLPVTGVVASVGEKSVEKFELNAERAQQLLAEAGFPGGARFPRVRLLVNRNEQQRQVAQAVASMWRSTLGVQTEIIVRGWEDYEAALRVGDFDVARRSVVMQTTDEESNLLAMFPPEPSKPSTDGNNNLAAGVVAPGAVASGGGGDAPAGAASVPQAAGEAGVAGRKDVEKRAIAQAPPILTEAQALKELPGFPVYFASSYALVKPYVRGFETNLLDAPSLKHVRIDSSWKPPAKSEPIRLVHNGGR